MNLLDLFTRTYARLHNYPGVPYWVLTPLRRFVRYLANKTLPKYLAQKRTPKGKVDQGVLVSFTSFPARINNVWQVVECMMRQTYQPAKIILWLSKEQFPDGSGIPASLKEREGDLFEIRMVDGDIRSHKKYYYASKEYPDSLLFIIDDDIYYETDIIERAMKAHLEYPCAVICNYAYHFSYDKDGKLKPYNSWKKESYPSQSNDLFFGSGGGTLFCPSWLHNDLTNIEKATEMTPTADDIWLNAMVRLSDIPVVKLKQDFFLPIQSDESKALAVENRGVSRNDDQIKNVSQHYLLAIGKDPFAKRINL